MSGCARQELASEKEEAIVPAVEMPAEPAIEMEEAIELPTETIIPDEFITEEKEEEAEEPKSLFPGGTILYQQDGVTFEHYFPHTGSLKGDESEILIYNQGNTAVQIMSSDQKFIVAGRTYEQYSGTWEKFPAVQSWERIDYINIHPRYYQTQPLILESGQKGKLHWHYQFAGDIRGKEQAVDIKIAFKVGAQSYTLERRVNREPNTENISSGESGHG